jgi:UDP-N-acetylglucosamine 2-epimerase (non-hydrolysing)
MKLKVLSIVGTRPEIIRLSRVFNKLDKYCDHIIVHTGQNYDYELNQVFFDNLDIRQPNYFLNSAVNTSSPINVIGNILINIDKVLDESMPDALLVLGDTNSSLAVIAAKRKKIPIFHMEAGNRCFDDRVPEEINRRIVDHISDINLTYSSIAREYLIREGISPDKVIKVGSPMYEVLMHNISNINLSNILVKLKLEEKQFFLVSAHREENIDPEDSAKKLGKILNWLAENYNLPVIVSTHPRTKNRFDSLKIQFHPNVDLQKPLGFFDYIKLQTLAKATLSDSGTINEEASILNFPALNLRETHERPEGMEEAAVIMAGLDLERIKQGLNILDSQSRGIDNHNGEAIFTPKDYCVPNVSDKIVRVIQSYVDYVNRSVWRRY